jgi:hypothetical protein
MTYWLVTNCGNVLAVLFLLWLFAEIMPNGREMFASVLVRIEAREMKIQDCCGVKY